MPHKFCCAPRAPAVRNLGVGAPAPASSMAPAPMTVAQCGNVPRHVSLVDAQLYSSMRLISGTVRSTPLPWLPVLTNIEPPALRRRAATDKLITQAECYRDWPLGLPSTPSNRRTRLQPNFTFSCRSTAGQTVHENRLLQACFPVFSTDYLELAATNSSHQ